ncbi:hypothetical protein B0I31_105145 [Saccharothrix carnea]|uniref:Uncharacterized protein n=1 Tax=Saccharothrix carnea TaxID=1280637 RepID=A0A2P8I9R3_SACCR|nr:hypothetical protein B0I31_105145 [Saccharothrix carnea]
MTDILPIRPRTVVVDVLNVMRRVWRPGAPGAYDWLMGVGSSLKAWPRLGPCREVRYVGDPELLDMLHPTDRPKFEKLMKQGRLYLAPQGQKADLTVLALAKGADGIVVADDEFRAELPFGHEWLLFDLKRAVRPKRSKGRWRWTWKDQECFMPGYYGRPDDGSRAVSRKYLLKIEAVTGLSFRDPVWPSAGEPVGFPHMARDLVKPVWWVRNRADKLGIPRLLSTCLTDEQVLRLRGDSEGLQQEILLSEAA